MHVSQGQIRGERVRERGVGEGVWGVAVVEGTSIQNARIELVHAPW